VGILVQLCGCFGSIVWVFWFNCVGVLVNCVGVLVNCVGVLVQLCGCFGSIVWVFGQLCGCFSNMCTCIYCVLYCLYCFFVLFLFLYLFLLNNKGIKMNCWETLYTNILYKQGLLISEQQVTDNNPLFDLATVPRDLQATSPNSSSQLGAPDTHTTG